MLSFVRHTLLSVASLVVLGACAHVGGGGGEVDGSLADVVGTQAFPSPLAGAGTQASPEPLEPLALAAAPPNSDAVTKTINPKAWRHFKLPGKRATLYKAALQDGRKVVRVQAQSSVSMLRYGLRVEPQQLAGLRFSWKVPQLIKEADLSDRDLDDAPVRLVLAFDGDTRKFSVRNAMLSELSRTLTGEPMPYATLMYVWSNGFEPGTVVNNPRTDRIRKMVVESGGKNLGHWLDYERDIRADFVKAFGEEPGALLGVALMTDTDNTQSSTMAYYGPVSLAKLARGDARTSSTTSSSNPADAGVAQVTR